MYQTRILGLIATIAILSAVSVMALAHPDGAPRQHEGKMASKQAMDHSRYGGPSYSGKPALTVTASLVEAGGGPAHYSTATALTNMVGAATVKAEVAKLTKQYGADKVKTWLSVFDFAVKDALGIATKAGIKLPKGNLKGKKLAEALVTAGLDKDGTFYVEFMLDKALSHGIHEQVMDNIDAKFSPEADSTYHQITNQAMYDLAQALGAKKVKLASFH